MSYIQMLATGPVFDGRAPVMIKAFMHDVVNEVSKDALSEVFYTQQEDFKQPTGAYWSRMRSVDVPVRQGFGKMVTNTSVYAPWLEGVSSRNQSTRFKGYQNFRRAVQTVAEGVHSTMLRVAQWTLERIG